MRIARNGELMMSRLFTTVSGLSLVLCVATMALWISARFTCRQWPHRSTARVNRTTVRWIDSGGGWDIRSVALESVEVLTKSPNPADSDYFMTHLKATPPRIDVEESRFTNWFFFWPFFPACGFGRNIGAR
jgi:hypothetical protein